MSPITDIIFPLPGTTSTTLGGALSSLEYDSSYEEDLYPMLALLGVLVPPS